MTDLEFKVFLTVITADLIKFIMQKDGIEIAEVGQMLYTSHLYELLEREETKVWHYSTPVLYRLLKEELETGSIMFP